MSDLVQCTRCRKKMIDEEYDSHDCIPKIKKIKTIKYASYFLNEDKQRGKMIEIRGIDGTHYEFVEVPENKEYTKIPYQIPLSTERKHEQESTEDEDSALIRQIYNWWLRNS